MTQITTTAVLQLSTERECSRKAYALLLSGIFKVGCTLAIQLHGTRPCQLTG